MDSANIARRTLLFSLAALLLLAASTAHAADYGEVCKVDSTLNHNGALSFISIAFMLVALAIGLAYMHGKIRMEPQSESWAKDEAQNLVITVLLFAGLLVFFGGACGLAASLVGADPFDASYSYIDNLVTSSGLGLLRQMTYASQNWQLDATRQLYIGFTPYAGYSIGQDANLRALSAHAELMTDIYLPIVASLTAQKYLLQMIEVVSSNVLLPFAFILRLVPPTRDFGNMMLALFFGLYIVVPTMYAMSSAAFKDVVNHPSSITGYDFSDFAFGTGTGSSALLYRLGAVIPQAIFLPNLVLIVLISCTTAVAKALRAFAV